MNVNWNRPTVHLLGLLLLGAAVMLPNLGQERWFSMREPRHAEIARQMAVSGDYIVPRTPVGVYIDKPPLYNMTVAWAFRLTGRQDFGAARLPGVCFGLAAAVGIWLLGRRWLTPRAAGLAAAIWLTSWLVIEWSRRVQMDAMLSALVLYGVLLADVAATRPGLRRLAWWGAASLCVGAATLSKGPVALFFFLAAAVPLWRVRQGRWAPPIGLVLMTVGVTALLFGAWAWAAEARQPGHLRALLDYQFREGINEHPGRPSLYVEQVLLRTAPWGIFVAGAGWWAVRRLRRRQWDGIGLPALAFGAGFLALTLFPNKREHYLLPILPMWTLFLAAFIDHALARRAPHATASSDPVDDAVPAWAFDWPLRIGLTAMAVAGLAAPGLWMLHADGLRGVGLAVYLLLAVILIAGAAASWRRRWSSAFGALLLACALGFASVYPLFMGHALRPPTDMAPIARLAECIPEGVTTGVYRVQDEYLFFKLRAPAKWFDKPEDLRRFADQSNRRAVVLPAADLPLLRSLTPRPLRTLATAPHKSGELATVLVEEDSTAPTCR